MQIFYPVTMPGAEKLPFYAEHFPTVEVNYSFYRLPARSVFEQWRARTPDGFSFAVKGSRYLTHIKRLADPDEPVDRLMDRAGGLSETLGPILLQMPPSFRLDLDRLTGLLSALQHHAPQRFALEFRHRSWLNEEVYGALAGAGIALCLPVSPDVPLDVRLTTSWTYIRMHRGTHGFGYHPEELDLWADRMREWTAEGIDAYVYFNNDPDGHAIVDARKLQSLLT